jgi:hypothetical protein
VWRVRMQFYTVHCIKTRRPRTPERQFFRGQEARSLLPTQQKKRKRKGSLTTPCTTVSGQAVGARAARACGSPVGSAVLCRESQLHVAHSVSCCSVFVVGPAAVLRNSDRHTMGSGCSQLLATDPAGLPPSRVNRGHAIARIIHVNDVYEVRRKAESKGKEWGWGRGRKGA